MVTCCENDRQWENCNGQNKLVLAENEINEGERSTDDVAPALKIIWVVL